MFFSTCSSGVPVMIEQALVRTVHSSLSAEKNSTGTFVKMLRFVAKRDLPTPGAAASSENCPRLKESPCLVKMSLATGSGGLSVVARFVVDSSGTGLLGD